VQVERELQEAEAKRREEEEIKELRRKQEFKVELPNLPGLFLIRHQPIIKA